MSTRHNNNVGIIAAAAIASLTTPLAKKVESGMTEAECVMKMPSIIAENWLGIDGKPVKNHHAACMGTIRSLLGLPAGSTVPATVYGKLKEGLGEFVMEKVKVWHAGAIHSTHTQSYRVMKGGVDGDGTTALVGTRTTTSLHRKTPEEQREAAIGEMVKLREKMAALVDKGFEATTADQLAKLAHRVRILRKAAHGLREWLPNTELMNAGPLLAHMAEADTAAAAAMAAAKAAGVVDAPKTVELASGATVGKRVVGVGPTEVVAEVKGKRASKKAKAAVLGVPLPK